MTVSWPPKDPDWVESYRYEPQLDPGEQVSTIAVARLSGDVVIDSQQGDDAGLNVFLSGGTNSSTTVFRVAYTTTGGRSLDDVITITVQENPSSADVTGFRLRYPAFVNVDGALIAYWLQDATRIVNDGWGVDQQPATFALAAHNMTLGRASGISDGGASQIPSGVTRFRSASVDISLTETAANASLDAGYGATRYGQEFAVMLRRNTGGPMLVGYVEPRCDWAWF